MVLSDGEAELCIAIRIHAMSDIFVPNPIFSSRLGKVMLPSNSTAHSAGKGVQGSQFTFHHPLKQWLRLKQK
jgi:hypothetical protein